jgi:hypothetical protein
LSGLAWYVVGVVDFITAVFLGATSQPGSPIRIFFDAPGTALLGALPRRFIPAYFVPLFLILRHRHLRAPVVAPNDVYAQAERLVFRFNHLDVLHMDRPLPP